MGVCPYCGKENKLLEKHINSCIKNPKNNYTESEQEVTLDSFNKFLELPYAIQNVQKVFFLCTNCGRKVSKKRFFGIEKNLLCKGCVQKLADNVKCQYCGLSLSKTHLSRHENVCEENPKNTIPDFVDDNNVSSFPIGILSTKQISYICKKCNTLRKVQARYFQTLDTCKVCERAKTSLERYGVERAQKAVMFREKARQKQLEKTERQKRKIEEKRKQTCLKKYGVPFVSQSSEIRQKQIQTLTSKSEEERKAIQEKRSQTCLERYGTTNLTGNYEYDNILFDSSWELALWIYAKDHNEEIEREPTYFEYTADNKVHKYYPDFRYKGDLIEIKGDMFLKEDGTWENIHDKGDNLIEEKRKCALSNNVKIWYKKDIDFALDYVNTKYTEDYLRLFNKKIPFPYPKRGKGDCAEIRYFHKSIFEATRKGKLSPLQAWFDKTLVKKAAANRLKYVGRCRPSDIVLSFSIAHIAPKISVFKPSTAQYLINKYLKDSETIFDPFSGFSGRLLGAFRCNKTYIGQDINEKHVNEANEIMEDLKIANCSVSCQNILTDTEKTYDSLFTCPPYGGKEHWSENNDEIEKSCDEWIDICMQKYRCQKYLFVVDSTEKYKDSIVETLQTKSHLGLREEYVILITALS